MQKKSRDIQEAIDFEIERHNELEVCQIKDQSKRMKVIEFALSKDEELENDTEAIRIAQEYFERSSSKGSSD